MEPQSRDLLHRAREGEPEAFDALVGPLVEPGYRLAYGLLLRREPAEEAVQRAVLAAWRRRRRLRPGLPLRPWFLGMVVDVGRGSLPARLFLWERGAPDDDPDPIVRGRALRAELRRLPFELRAVLVLRHGLDLPLEEVAAVIREPVGVARRRLQRALEELGPRVPLEAYT